MKRLGAVVLVLLGTGLMLLGLLFLMGAAGRGHRYAVAAAGLGGGAVLVGAGVRLFKSAEAASPEQLRAEILELARRRSGELAWSDVEAALGRRAEGARRALAALEEEGLCRRQDKAGASFWVFEDLQPRLLVVRCQFCQAELSPGAAAKQCPNCGGTLETRVERRSFSDGDYKMDE
jgi:predicted RNA-binding Zn-ribbon protein involved in translation (DUF1610 family)